MQFLYRFEAMRTPCEVVLFGKSKIETNKVAEAILHELKRLEKKYNYFSASSYLSTLNSRQSNELDLETKHLLQRAVQYYRQTYEIFDITTATIKDLYRSDISLEVLKAQKEALLPYVGCEHFSIKKNRLYFDNPYTKIDLGGFVKEYGVNQAVKIVRKAKIKSALLNFGGDIYALGRKPNAMAFKVGIKDPKNPLRFAKFVEICDEALTTSASYERNVTIEGRRFSHIIAKRGEGDLSSSVTVIAPNCVESGVFSTALMIDPSLKTEHRTILL